MRFFRQLVIVNTDPKVKAIVATREERATNSAARITKDLYKLLSDGKHIAYYAHEPSKIRKPMIINGRYYVKPQNFVVGQKP